jgi:iron complex outermembrane receptor protein
MAENIDRTINRIINGTQIGSAFNNATLSGADPAKTHQQARSSADAGRYLPGTDEFNA